MDFFLGVLAGASLVVGGLAIWLVWWPPTEGVHVRKVYPRKTTMPPTEGKRLAGRPTNTDQPPSTIRRALYRGRRETRD